jgi:hypothetical protein
VGSVRDRVALLARVLQPRRLRSYEADRDVAVLLRVQMLQIWHSPRARVFHVQALSRGHTRHPRSVRRSVRSLASHALFSCFLLRLALAFPGSLLSCLAVARCCCSFPTLAECPLLSRALRGYKKLRPASKSIRLPITTSVLSSLKSKVTRSRKDTILWAMMTVGVYGLFRLGELTVRDSSSEPLLMDAYTRVSASHRTIRLASSKTDIAREGVVIHLHANGSPSCPIAALDNLFALRIHGVSTAPIFPGKDGKPLSRDAVCCSVPASIPLFTAGIACGKEALRACSTAVFATKTLPPSAAGAQIAFAFISV